jgi:hypothetical protein
LRVTVRGRGHPVRGDGPAVRFCAAAFLTHKEHAPMSQIPPSTPSSGSGRTNKAPNPAEITVLAGSGVVLIFSFLAFYEVSLGSFSDSRNAWGTGLFPLATLIVLFAVVAGLLVGLGLLGVNVPERIATFSRAQILLICGVFATLQSIAFMIVDHTGADLGIGFWFMLLGSIAVLVGAVMAFRTEVA